MRAFIRQIMAWFRKPPAPARPKFQVDIPKRAAPQQIGGWAEFVRQQLAEARTPAERQEAGKRIMAFRKEKLGY